MDVEDWTGLALVQPTRRREWELRQGDRLVAGLRLPSMRRGGTAGVGDRKLEIRVSGVFNVEHLVVDAQSGETVARVRRNTLERPGLENSTWKSLGRGQGRGFVGADGEPWLRAKVSSGFFQRTGQVEVAPEHDVGLPALLAAYLLIRKAEEDESAAVTTVVVT
jgi:hypothetical protein